MKNKKIPLLPPGFKTGDKLIMPTNTPIRIQVWQSDMEEALKNGELGDFFNPDKPSGEQLN